MTRTQFIATLATIPFIGKFFKKKEEIIHGMYFHSRTNNTIRVQAINTGLSPSSTIEIEGEMHYFYHDSSGSFRHEVYKKGKLQRYSKTDSGEPWIEVDK